MKKNVANPMLLFAIVCIISSCGLFKKKEAFINPPIPALDPEYSITEIDASKGGEIMLPSGTKISIPPDCLTDENGKSVQGNITIKYREFHNALDIFLSGIPMTYVDKEKSGIFQTAGMFDIRAEQNGNNLLIAKGKSISVKMASFEKGDDYQFYFLDEKKGSWVYQATRSPEMNTIKDSLLLVLNESKPDLKFPLNKDYFVFNYYSFLDIYFDDDREKIHSNYTNKKVKSKAIDYGLSWTNFYTGYDIKFKGTYQPMALMLWKKLGRGAWPKWKNNELYVSDYNNLGNNKYELILKDYDHTGKEYRIKVEAVMPLRSLLAFSPDEWKNNYESNLAKIEQELERVAMMADAYRTFEINNFGIFNWDKLMKEDRKIFVKASFKFDEEYNPKLFKPQIVYIPGDNKSVIKFDQYMWNQLPLMPDTAGKLFALLPGNKLAFMSSEEYATINFDSLRNVKDPDFTFHLKTQPGTVDNPDKLKELLGI